MLIKSIGSILVEVKSIPNWYKEKTYSMKLRLNG